MPKLVTNNRDDNLAYFDNDYWKAKLMFGITNRLLKAAVLYRYGVRQHQRQYKQFKQFVGQTLMLVCIKNNIPTKAGFVYAVVHPNFPNSVKLGMTKDCEDRIQQYNVCCPKKQFKVVWQRFVTDRRKYETLLHDTFSNVRQEGEWFALKTHDTLKLKQELNSVVPR